MFFKKLGGNIVLVQAFLLGPFDHIESGPFQNRSQSRIRTILESISDHNQEPVRDWDKSIIRANPKSGPVHNRDKFGNGNSQLSGPVRNHNQPGFGTGLQSEPVRNQDQSKNVTG